VSDLPDDNRVFPPPDVPLECFCLHCGRVYMSNLMLPVEIDGEIHYACPAEGCTAMGWEFDIFPVDDDQCTTGQWHYFDDDDEDVEDDELNLPDSASAAKDGEPTDHFDPPREWTPEADADDDEEEVDVDIDIDGDPSQGERFTQEDFDRLKASGEMDRKIQEIRSRWRTDVKKREARGETSSPDDSTSQDDDIPF